jgi:cytochrome c2
MNARGVTGLLALAGMLTTLLAGCDPRPTAGDFTTRADGNAGRGAKLIARAGCGTCHDIPGVRRANGRIAPPLTAFADRAWIAGQIHNTPANLARWIENPPALVPATPMPVVGVSETDAHDMAAYLFTLH